MPVMKVRHVWVGMYDSLMYMVVGMLFYVNIFMSMSMMLVMMTMTVLMLYYFMDMLMAMFLV